MWKQCSTKTLNFKFGIWVCDLTLSFSYVIVPDFMSLRSLRRIDLAQFVGGSAMVWQCKGYVMPKCYFLAS